ncbi:DUF4907 domain-containing protein [Algibacter sp. Ld11]|uniref:DUF4907 domain-containing protein n=1 Tax=Algibacter sp. Ld11 TaxID=649150 RepID=UPI00386CF6AD
MMFKRKLIVVLAITLVSISALYLANSDILKAPNPYKTEVFKVKNGFGYQINYNSKLLIKQDYIPAIESNQTFCTIEDANRVAHLVSTKLFNKENPKITLENLNQLNIALNCNN